VTESENILKFGVTNNTSAASMLLRILVQLKFNVTKNASATLCNVENK